MPEVSEERMESKVLSLAKEIIETCQKRTSSIVVATTATQIAGATISAEWNPADVSQSSLEEVSPRVA
jgi:hypothetical protein